MSPPRRCGTSGGVGGRGMSGGLRWTAEQYAAWKAQHMAHRETLHSATRVASQGAAMPEEHLLQHIRARAKQLGYLVYHTRNSRKSDAGWPDLVLCNGERLIIAEV